MGGGSEAEQSYNLIRKAMTNAVVTPFFDREQLTCVFTDASDDFWGMVITQIPPEEEGLPVHEQTHKPLAFVSGRFRGGPSLTRRLTPLWKSYRAMCIGSTQVRNRR